MHGPPVSQALLSAHAARAPQSASNAKKESSILGIVR
jgi:hypothetical protein